jgi:hypothetical protein
MAFDLTGYIVEKPRVGAGNSPFSASPDVFISNLVAFSLAYPSSEVNPATEYCMIVQDQGTGDLPDAAFGWTKNEVIQRFGYDSKNGRHATLPGNVIEVSGKLSADSNTTRLKVTKLISDDLVAYPARVSVATGSSGTTFTIEIVDADDHFTTPPAGTVQVSMDTGNLNWAAEDLVTYLGKEVWFQRQAFYQTSEVKSGIGKISTGGSVLLNPIPSSGQFPRIRIGFGLYLTSIEKPSESGFSPDPAPGTVEWALNTGLLKFNSSDLASNVGKTLYYDGVFCGSGLRLTLRSLGTVDAPLPLSPLPAEGGDIVFRAYDGSLRFQFPAFSYVDNFSDAANLVNIEIKRSDGSLAFPLWAKAAIYHSNEGYRLGCSGVLPTYLRR